jgi:hypothetical protein
MWDVGCGIWILNKQSYWLKNPNSKSQIPNSKSLNRKSAICNPQSEIKLTTVTIPLFYLSAPEGFPYFKAYI